MTHILVSLDTPDGGRAIGAALRRGLPDIRRTAVMESPPEAGERTLLFDDVRPRPAEADDIPERLVSDPGLNAKGDILFLPSSALEAYQLAETADGDDKILSPSAQALQVVTGPNPPGASRLPVRTPEWMAARDPVERLHAFGRRHNWELWMESTVGARTPLTHWDQFDRRWEELTQAPTPGADLAVRQRIDGTRLTLPFAAHRGTLLDAALIRRDEPSGAHEVATVPSSVRSALADVIRDVDWTGGGSIAIVEDPDGEWWLDRWSPHFTSLVDDLSRCGPNLPALLVAAASGVSVQSSASSATRFVQHSHSAPSAPSAGHGDREGPENDPLTVAGSSPGAESLDAPLSPDLDAILSDLPSTRETADTPQHVLLPRRTENRFQAFAGAAQRLKAVFDVQAARIGLSMKTNPSNHLLRTARETGMLAETIHRDEMTAARENGYCTDEIIVNGPVQALLPTLDTAPYAMFGDAIEDLTDLPFDPSDAIIGVRTRPPERGPSRFGVDLSDPDRMRRLCDRFATLPPSTRIGLHLHAPSSTLGHDRWWSSLERVLHWAETIQRKTGRAIACLDLGGGWHPDDWLHTFIPGLIDRREVIEAALPALDVLLLEPGKALSQPLGVVVSRVVDARPHRNEVILDASIAECSNIDYHPHRLLAHTSSHGWHRLPRGSGRLLGRLCMEADILGRHRHVDHLAAGDTVVICDTGAYDTSMAYPFGRGRSAAY